MLPGNLYFNKYNECYSLLEQLINNTTGPVYKAQFNDLRNMLQTFGDHANKSINLKQLDQSSLSYQELDEASNVNELINFTYDKYYRVQFQAAQVQAENLILDLKRANAINIFIIVSTLSCVFTALLLFSIKLTRPILELSRNAILVSNEQFDVPDVKVNSKDEMQILAQAFNKMINSIRFFIEELRLKSDLEQRLYAEENKNLRTENILRDTKLRVLQAQMNPHFLFNTLNLISRTSYLEGAPQTVQLIDATTDFLRYSLYRAEDFVSIFDEITLAETYIYLQQMRFGKRITFTVNVDEQLEDIRVPTLVIQPIIENAIAHGVDNLSQGASIRVDVLQRSGYALVRVEDNGIGMSEEQIIHSLDGSINRTDKSGGLGLYNVKQRLELFSGRNDPIHIESQVGHGCRIELNLYGKEVVS